MDKNYQAQYEKLLIKYKDLQQKHKNEVKKNTNLTFIIWHRFRSYLANLEGLMNLEEVKDSENILMYKKVFRSYSKEIVKFANKYAHEEDEKNNP